MAKKKTDKRRGLRPDHVDPNRTVAVQTRVPGFIKNDLIDFADKEGMTLNQATALILKTFLEEDPRLGDYNNLLEKLSWERVTYYNNLKSVFLFYFKKNISIKKEAFASFFIALRYLCSLVCNKLPITF